MFFSCTRKVIDKVKNTRQIENEKPEIGLYNWYINSLIINRKTHFLFTNSLTLFSFFLYAGTRKEINSIEHLFEEKLQEMIVREIGSSDTLLEVVLPQKRDYSFTRTNNRSVLGSMNDFIFQINYLTNHRGSSKENFDLTNHMINECPMKGINYECPSKKMKAEIYSRIESKK